MPPISVATPASVEVTTLRAVERYRHVMHRAASALTAQQIEDLAAYYGSLAVEGPAQAR